MTRFLGTVLLFGCCLQLMLLHRVNAVPEWVSPDIIEMVQGEKQRCMKLHGTTEDMIEKVNAGILVNDRSITCYMFCLMEAFSLVDEEMNIEVDMLVSFFPPHMKSMAQDLLNQCADAPKTEPCDWIYTIAECVFKVKPEIWFVI